MLWNTVYLERATQALRESGKLAKDDMLQYLSPLGWEHINLTGDYVWRQNRKTDDGQFRPLGFRNNERIRLAPDFLSGPNRTRYANSSRDKDHHLPPIERRMHSRLL